jgi:nucleotide-binding universal stress UspA family protein
MFPAAALTAVAVPVVAPDWTGPEADKPLDEVVAGARDEAIAAVKQDLADLVARVAKASPDAPMIATAIVEGTPPVALASYVETAWPDLLVCGTHGRTGREGRGGAGSEGVGSVAEALLSTLPCDVLVAPDTA